MYSELDAAAAMTLASGCHARCSSLEPKSTGGSAAAAAAAASAPALLCRRAPPPRPRPKRLGVDCAARAYALGLGYINPIITLNVT